MPRRKKQSTPEPTPISPPPYTYNPAAKRWLWVWVGVFTAIILVLWGWATKITLSSFNWKKTPEKQLIESSKNNWNDLFNEETSKIKKEQMRLQLQNIISKMVTETNSTTSSTTITATSTNIIGSTSTTSSTQ